LFIDGVNVISLIVFFRTHEGGEASVKETILFWFLNLKIKRKPFEININKNQGKPFEINSFCSCQFILFSRADGPGG
jgi:hypothetical protein